MPISFEPPTLYNHLVISQAENRRLVIVPSSDLEECNLATDERVRRRGNQLRPKQWNLQTGVSLYYMLSLLAEAKHRGQVYSNTSFNTAQNPVKPVVYLQPYEENGFCCYQMGDFTLKHNLQTGQYEIWGSQKDIQNAYQSFADGRLRGEAIGIIAINSSRPVYKEIAKQDSQKHVAKSGVEVDVVDEEDSDSTDCDQDILSLRLRQSAVRSVSNNHGPVSIHVPAGEKLFQMRKGEHSYVEVAQNALPNDAELLKSNNPLREYIETHFMKPSADSNNNQVAEKPLTPRPRSVDLPKMKEFVTGTVAKRRLANDACCKKLERRRRLVNLINVFRLCWLTQYCSSLNSQAEQLQSDNQMFDLLLVVLSDRFASNTKELLELLTDRLLEVPNSKYQRKEDAKRAVTSWYKRTKNNEVGGSIREFVKATHSVTQGITAGMFGHNNNGRHSRSSSISSCSSSRSSTPSAPGHGV